MQFLDAIGLAYFWEKIKTWVGQNYLSLSGGMIDGDVRFGEGSNPKEMIEINSNLLWVVKANQDGTYSGSSMTYTETTSPKFIKAGGTATQVLMADGSVKELSQANGIPVLDAGGNIPLSQLGNLDTTVAEVVAALPTSNIKRHIYLVKDSDTTNNKYAEYVYTGDISAAYDSTKWEKFGDFRATVDLADYAKKSDTVKSIAFSSYGSTPVKILKVTKADGTEETISIPKASSGDDGFMGSDDKRKLDGIANNANNYSLPTASSTTKGGITLGYSQNDKNYPVALDNSGKAYVNVPWTDTNTTYGLATSTNDGLMSSADKTKIDSIDTIYAKKTQAANDLSITPQESQVNFTLLDIEDADELSDNVLQQATSKQAGVMTASDKNKLDGIASGATADSAITTTEIDALFA